MEWNPRQDLIQAIPCTSDYYEASKTSPFSTSFNMKYTALLAFLALAPAALAGPAAAAAPLQARAAAAAPVERSLDNLFEKRACGATSCVCNGVQGQFCGDELVNSACIDSHVYECQAGTGKACDYGVRDSCAKCGSLDC